MSFLSKALAIRAFAANLRFKNSQNFSRYTKRGPVSVIPPAEYQELTRRQNQKSNALQQEIKVKWRHKLAASAEVVKSDVGKIETPQEHEEISRRQVQKSNALQQEIKVNWRHKTAPSAEVVKSDVGKIEKPQDHEEISRRRAQALQQEIKVNWRQKTAAPAEVVESDVGNSETLTHKVKDHFTEPKKKVKTTDMLETVLGADGNFIYTKMKNNDPRISQLLTTIKSKKGKIKRDLILLEGKRLINEALLSKCTLKYLIFSRKEELEFFKENLPKAGAQLYKMPYKEMQMWSDLTTCPGIMGIFRTPDVKNYVPTNTIPLTIICDNIREPGNLGAILRACAGAGCQKLILTKGCANLWDTKVTRSAAGSHFHTRILDQASLNDIKSNIKENAKIFIADINGASGAQLEWNNSLAQNIPLVPYYSAQFSESEENFLIIGGETNGISADSYKLAEEFNGVRLNIPLENNVESLNSGTALGIICFEIKRQLNIKHNNPVVPETDVSLSLRYL